MHARYVIYMRLPPPPRTIEYEYIYTQYITPRAPPQWSVFDKYNEFVRVSMKIITYTRYITPPRRLMLMEWV